MEDCDSYDDGVATDALPLAMTPQQSQELVGTDVNVANVTLNASMKPVLQRFCDATASPAEKAKALELLTALEMSGAIKAEAPDGRPRRALTPAASSDGGEGRHDGGRRRPRTAAPRFLQQQQLQQLRTPPPPSDCDTSGIVGGGGGGGGLSYVNSYETTHNYYYQPPLPSPTRAVRPASSQMQRVVPPPAELAPGNSFGDLFQTTTYGREFFAKSDAARRPERAASARGVRNNNPHPNQEFMVWRYRRPMTATEKIECAATSADSEPSPQPQALHEQQLQHPQLTNESFDRAVRGKCRSTYQQDYLGVPTSFDVGQRAIALLALEGRAAPAYDRGSMSRTAFGKPPSVPPVLAVAKARFGHNPARAQPGVIPAGGLGGQAFGTRTRTTYDAHICEPASRLMRVADLRQYSNAQNALAVGRMLDGVSAGGERAALMKLYREMQSRQLPVSIPLPVERRIYKERVGGHARVATQPAYLSTWAGP